MGYQVIDEKNWKRAIHCAVFRDSVEPSFCVSFELDITNFLQKTKQQQLSFTFALMYAATKCGNQIEEFRYRFLDGKVVLYDQIHTAFTYLNPKTELFKVVNVPMVESMEKYVILAKKTAEEQEGYFTGPLGNDIFQFSPLPWISFTHISHTISGKKDNVTPLIDWGKYFQREDRIFLPFSIQAHHSFVDGLHMGKFVDILQEYLENY